MDIDEIRSLLPNYIIHKYADNYYNIVIDDKIRSYSKNFIITISKINSVIDKIIDIYDNYKMVVEFLLLNDFEPQYEHYTRTINEKTIYIEIGLYTYYCISFDCDETCFTSDGLITHLRKILDLESLNKPVIKNE